MAGGDRGHGPGQTPRPPTAGALASASRCKGLGKAPYWAPGTSQAHTQLWPRSGLAPSGPPWAPVSHSALADQAPRAGVTGMGRPGLSRTRALPGWVLNARDPDLQWGRRPREGQGLSLGCQQRRWRLHRHLAAQGAPPVPPPVPPGLSRTLGGFREAAGGRHLRCLSQKTVPAQGQTWSAPGDSFLG